MDLTKLTYQQFFQRFAMKRGTQTVPAKLEKFQTLTGHTFYQREGWQRHCTRLGSSYPSQGERYYLRLLLKSSVARHTFESIRTINDVTYDTYGEAAKAAGLLEGHTYVENVMREAVEEQAVFPYQLRFLFMILILNHECSAKSIFNQYLPFMVDDYEEVDDPEAARERLLREISEDLQENGKSNTDCGLPEPENLTAEEQSERRAYGSRTAIKRYYEELYNMVKNVREQSDLFDDIMQHIYPRGGGDPVPFAGLIKAPGGAGKTTLLRCVLSAVRSRGDIALATATTALAALNYIGGHTAHGLHKIPVVDNITREEVRCTMSVNSPKADLLRKAKVIVWDEISMAHRKCIEAVDLMLQDVMKSKLPFGGKVFIFAGDFRQLPPVLPRSEESNETTTLKASLRGSDLYGQLNRRELKRVQRSANDAAYTDMCLKVRSLPREGECPVQ
ncbi:unnamed protein product [Vitrella brassicaformis CCMP3155]|uniref:ATP-dependent DNA helicase n=1 Tax=Vitrella brassicaformis (strain CCMP3155) TaxID=1169540 RepID=A0A0G4EEJ2_VITBC|nr:unnamed protein product [Vitrella brassicaformis CCMP3155]|eukprot:CEL93982.1 unnamed protein product [Vitrella brassicaformis CCMP3155]